MAKEGEERKQRNEAKGRKNRRCLWVRSNTFPFLVIPLNLLFCTINANINYPIVLCAVDLPYFSDHIVITVICFSVLENPDHPRSDM